MDYNYLRENFVSHDYGELLEFMISLNLGSWIAGVFQEKDDLPCVVLYNPEEGVVVIARIEPHWEADFFDPVDVLENGATVREVYSHTVEPESTINEVMLESMDVALREHQ